MKRDLFFLSARVAHHSVRPRFICSDVTGRNGLQGRLGREKRVNAAGSSGRATDGLLVSKPLIRLRVFYIYPKAYFVFS